MTIVWYLAPVEAISVHRRMCCVMTLNMLCSRIYIGGTQHKKNSLLEFSTGIYSTSLQGREAALLPVQGSVHAVRVPYTIYQLYCIVREGKLDDLPKPNVLSIRSLLAFS